MRTTRLFLDHGLGRSRGWAEQVAKVCVKPWWFTL